MNEENRLLALVSRLLALAEESDQHATQAGANGQRSAAQRHTGRAQAYRHAARIAGAPAELK